jgi:arabinogalactan endo-1,4-beta-galactosidase
MKKARIVAGLMALVASSLLIEGCGKSATNAAVSFSYDSTPFTPSHGSKTNNETHDYSSLIVNPLTQELRSDFAYGVDASMVYKVEALGGVYYNEAGQQQDVFQILAADGVNFFRCRLWNNPADKYGRTYGGGENNLDVDLALCKRAQAAGMNICVDFHYSDFWADPDHQVIPKDWQSLDASAIPSALKSYTTTALTSFKNAGINVAAVQLGNEINNGMMGSYGAINWNKMDDSFTYISSLLKAGIEGMKAVYPNAASIIHLSSGTNKEEYATYFNYLNKNGVAYDIIGASYYPHIHGSLSKLQANLDAISAQTNKPVMIMETSWGYTTDFVQDVTANEYDSTDEDNGGYLTSEQAQATCLRDVLDVLSKVPNKLGLGCFYWEPGWLPVSENGAVASWATARGQSYIYNGDDKHSSSYKDGLATWCNQGWFSYSGKALASASVYKKIKAGGANTVSETPISARKSAYEATINLAASETLPTMGKVVTNLAAIRDAAVVWTASEAAQCTKVGTYTIHGTLAGSYPVTLTANCIENFVVDPSFENQGETDTLKDPWVIRSVSPNGEKIVKIDRKSDYRSGESDLNWYYSSSDFSFDFYQTIKSLPAATYDLTTYLKAEAQKTIATKSLTLYIKIGTSEKTLDMTSLCVGWASGYQKAEITSITLSEASDVEIGIRGSVVARGWAHNDDWSLVKEA